MGCFSFIVTLLVIVGIALLTGVSGVLEIILWIIFGMCACVFIVFIVVYGIISVINKILFNK